VTTWECLTVLTFCITDAKSDDTGCTTDNNSCDARWGVYISYILLIFPDFFFFHFISSHHSKIYNKIHDKLKYYDILRYIHSMYYLGDVYLTQHYVIKFVSDLGQVGDFLWVLRFPPPIKLTTTYN
jgi:hypothetical protein